MCRKVGFHYLDPPTVTPGLIQVRERFLMEWGLYTGGGDTRGSYTGGGLIVGGLRYVKKP